MAWFAVCIFDAVRPWHWPTTAMARRRPISGSISTGWSMPIPTGLQAPTTNMWCLKNGARFAISDHRTNKSFDELIEHPDIDDMFYVPYPAGSAAETAAKKFRSGPSAIRAAVCRPCTAIAGRTKSRPKLKTIEWLPAHNGGRVAITTVNGVDQGACRGVARARPTAVRFHEVFDPDQRHL